MSTRPAPEATRKSPWFDQGDYFRRVLGGPARKVPLDAGMTCPNRDGVLSRSGCLFCNAAGSGTGLAAQGLNLAEQWARLAPRVRARHPDARLLAYLQAYSNTHCSPGRLRALLDEVAALPGPEAVSGLCLGTRPDCLDVGTTRERLDILGGFVPRLGFLQLDLGLQSADPQVLRRIGRGHGPEVFAQAARGAAARGMSVCAHLMHGLPGAGPDDLERSVELVNSLPVAAVKFHNTLVCRGTGLARLWEAGGYAPPSREAYVADLASALAGLRPDICVQRLAADPAPGELLAPDWGADKAGTLALLRAELARRGLSQGCLA
jgi:hypothetical protein